MSPKKTIRMISALIPLCCIMIVPFVFAEVQLEPYYYTVDFENRSLSAWASYPLWQDTAYDPNFRVNTIVPGDPNLSIVQMVTPYSNVDNYAGAQKKFDAYMVPGSTINLRYYLKSHLPFEFFKVRLAGDSDGKLDITIPNPPTNRWESLTINFADVIRENPHLAGYKKIKVNAIAVMAKVPKADPAVPMYLGLDDVTFKGARSVEFQFMNPRVYTLTEFKPRIAQKHYHQGDTFRLSGKWPLESEQVELTIVSFTDRKKSYHTVNLDKQDDEWSLKPLKLNYPEGMYLLILKALKGNEILYESRMTFVIAPKNIGGTHPRIWFDREKIPWITSRLKSERFSDVRKTIESNAESWQKRLPAGDIEWDFDQFPDEDALPTWRAWTGILADWGEAMYWNSLAYCLQGNREAGIYARDVLVRISSFPYWDHPWMLKRGRYDYLRNGELHQKAVIAYDLIFDLMNNNQAKLVRDAFMKNIVEGNFKTYVRDDMVTNDTSNWLAHVIGGALMCHTAIYGDDPEIEALEPYFSGSFFKMYDFVSRTFTPSESYGEGMGYYGTAMRALARSHPAVDRVFNIDFTGLMAGSYQEIMWSGNVADKLYFYYGDSGGLRPLKDWAWLLDKTREPLLGWLYNYLKQGEDFYDVLYETSDVPQKNPYELNPVRVFRNIGNIVFKSGWESDSFAFVMRSGPFINHQHLDQGSFWLADHGSIFIEERHGSSYYNDPLYQSWYTQPIGHSTILIDGNHQSQRAGDPLVFAEGFHDHAFIDHFLDGKEAAFATGDIGRLYWGKVKGIQRHVLYLKPRTLLMLDVIEPAERDVDVTLLYQTLRLEDITAGNRTSAIAKGNNILHITHLAPEHHMVNSVETPHYLRTLQNEKPLVREGTLTVTSRTSGQTLVMANLLTTTTANLPEVRTISGKGFISGNATGKEFVFTTKLHSSYSIGDFTTDALAVTWNESCLLAAMTTKFIKNGKLVISAEAPITFELCPDCIKYYHSDTDVVTFGVNGKPQVITVNDKEINDFTYNAEQQAVIFSLPSGEGLIRFTLE